MGRKFFFAMPLGHVQPLPLHSITQKPKAVLSLLYVTSHALSECSMQVIQPFKMFSLALSPLNTSAIQPHPLENFLQAFCRSTSSIQKISSAILPFYLIRSKIFFSHSTSSLQKISAAVQPFTLSILNGLSTRSLAVCSAIRMDTARNVFA